MSRGLGLGAILSLENLAVVAKEFSAARYGEGYREPLLASLCVTGTYLGALLAGILLASTSSKSRRFLALLPILGAISVAAVETTKATPYFTVILLTASYLATRVVVSAGRDKLITWPRLHKSVSALGALALLFIGIQLTRYGYSASNGGQLDEVIATLHVSAFGYLGAFSAWFHGHVGVHNDLTFGGSSFAGLLDIGGVRDRPAGLSQESVYVGASRIPTNIYTMFRMLIQDFGLAGSLLVLAIVGFIASRAFVGVTQGNTRYIPILAADYATTLWSPMTGYFEYNSLLLAFILAAAYLVITGRSSTGPQGGAGLRLRDYSQSGT
jgi:oligosaccharide repeat unit polymerase